VYVASVFARAWRTTREADSERLGRASTVATDALKMTAVNNPRETIRFIFMLSGVVVYYTPESGQSCAFLRLQRTIPGLFLLAFASPTQLESSRFVYR
jgi:hypothetical protein